MSSVKQRKRGRGGPGKGEYHAAGLAEREFPDVFRHRVDELCQELQVALRLI